MLGQHGLAGSLKRVQADRAQFAVVVAPFEYGSLERVVEPDEDTVERVVRGEEWWAESGERGDAAVEVGRGEEVEEELEERGRRSD